jgi:hypothetical protein
MYQKHQSLPNCKYVLDTIVSGTFLSKSSGGAGFLIFWTFWLEPPNHRFWPF